MALVLSIPTIESLESTYAMAMSDVEAAAVIGQTDMSPNMDKLDDGDRKKLVKVYSFIFDKLNESMSKKTVDALLLRLTENNIKTIHSFDAGTIEKLARAAFANGDKSITMFKKVRRVFLDLIS